MQYTRIYFKLTVCMGTGATGARAQRHAEMERRRDHARARNLCSAAEIVWEIPWSLSHVILDLAQVSIDLLTFKTNSQRLSLSGVFTLR